jgi:hypothetical protein
MLIPPPPPAYTLSPALSDLSTGQDAALGRALSAMTGSVSGVLVTAARSTALHHVLELATSEGPVLVIERAHGDPNLPLMPALAGTSRSRRR